MLFAIVFISIWSGFHAYLAWRLIRPMAPHGPWRRVAWYVLLASLVIVPGVFFTRILMQEPALTDKVAWVAYLNMGFILILVPLLVIRDCIAAVVRHARLLSRRHRHRLADPQITDASRRQFLANGANLGIIGLSGVMTGTGYHEARRLAEVLQISIPLAKLPEALDGFRIVQLSDIHLGPTIKGDYLQGIVERCNELRPDLVAITGDLVDGLTSMLQDDVAPLTSLQSRYGTFFVTGNHEYYWDALTWSDLLQTMGIHVLNNSHSIIRHNAARLLLAGATDYSAHRYVPGHASDPELARHRAARTDAAILLAHQPKSAFAGEAAGYDLQLSGHVHGGQFFPWNIMIGMVQPFTTGLHRVNGRMWLYVSAGTGYWGPPNRLGVPAEITEITLTRA
ncbi:MAG: metallophosphoesterase [Gammaproteobacteria bacterium]|nr:MAG: metallophosphoesterase [Gammaproteobacteria bacterium]